MEISFDVISDLRLSPEDSFNWEGKVTSLYCIVAGNISSNVRTVIQTLGHLSRHYQGVFYIPGTLEYEGIDDVTYRTDELEMICDQLDNVTILYQNVIIIDGIAILGANGWSASPNIQNLSGFQQLASKYDDIGYLHKSIEKLQMHLDVKKIIVVTNEVPNNNLYFGMIPETAKDQIPLDVVLDADTEKKVTTWVFGTSNNIVDIEKNNINYINNSYFNNKNNYWAKIITVTI